VAGLTGGTSAANHQSSPRASGRFVYRNEATNQPILRGTDGDLFAFLCNDDEKIKSNLMHFLIEPVYATFKESPELVGFLLMTLFETIMYNVVQ
jgi:hypothetical protein